MAEEVTVTESRSGSSFNHSAFRALGSIGVSNGGGVGSGGGLAAGGFGEDATAPSETELDEADERDDVDGCLFNYVTCDVTVSGSEYDSKVTVTARFPNRGRGIGQALRDFHAITSSLFASLLPASGLDAESGGNNALEGKTPKIGADTVFNGAFVVGGVFATGGAIAGAAYALAHLPAAFAAASSVSGGFLIAAAGIADIGMLAGVGAMTFGAPAFLGALAVFGVSAIAYNYWIADDDG